MLAYMFYKWDILQFAFTKQQNEPHHKHHTHMKYAILAHLYFPYTHTQNPIKHLDRRRRTYFYNILYFAIEWNWNVYE